MPGGARPGPVRRRQTSSRTPRPHTSRSPAAPRRWRGDAIGGSDGRLAWMPIVPVRMCEVPFRAAMLGSSSLVPAQSMGRGHGIVDATDRGGSMADQLLADDTDETDVPDDGTILTSDIDMDFAPRPIDDVTVLTVGDELVLYHPAQEILFALDRVGAIVWQCF